MGTIALTALLLDHPSLLNLPQAAGLRLLWQALKAALSLRRDPWEFAVEISELHALGMTNTDLRWLVCQGYAHHALERAHLRSGRRTFRRHASLSLLANSCFVLTPLGEEIAEARDGAAGPGADKQTDRPMPVPRWDLIRRQLFWGGRSLKSSVCRRRTRN